MNISKIRIVEEISMNTYKKFRSSYLNALFYDHLWNKNIAYINSIMGRYYTEYNGHLNGERLIADIKNASCFEMFQSSMNRLKTEILYKSNVHGIRHVERTCVLTVYIAKELRFSENEIRLCLEAAKYHDIGRRDDSEDPQHGYRGAIEIPHICTDFSNREKCLIAAVVAAHSLGDEDCPRIFREFGVSEMEFGKCRMYLSVLKDADALDRFRLNESSLRTKYLRNKISFSMIKAACEMTFYGEVNEM